MTETTTIELDHTIELKNRTITELELHEPTMGDMEATDLAEGDVGKSIHLIARLSGLSAGVIRKMRPGDFGKCSAFLAPFMAAFAGDDEEDDAGEPAADAEE